MGGKGKSFARALTTGRFPTAEVEKFARGEGSLVDEFLDDPARLLEDANDLDGHRGITTSKTLTEEASENVSGVPISLEALRPLPLAETGRALAALNHAVVSSADGEAVTFLIGSAVAKLWAHAFRDEDAAVAQAQGFVGGDYAERAKARFLAEYRQAKNLPIPTGYAFAPGGKLTWPNLMQRLVAVRVRDDRRVGNWSGTGAGKTLSAVLASRVVASRLTVICCPNAVVAGWASVIRDAFPDSQVAAKTFEPAWDDAAGGPRYLILHYEAFQQPDSADRMRGLVSRGPIDLIIIDEVHHAKQREPEAMSRRRANLSALLILSKSANPDFCVLGMSATPVVNNLQEGRSLVELVTGLAHDELATRPTVPNCMRLHQRLATLGIRWMPRYDTGFEQVEVPVDCSEYLDEIRELARRNAGPLQLEQVLTRSRLPVIREQIRPRTLIYTHYIAGIDRLLREAIEADGWRVGFHTGDDKSGLAGFLRGDIDVLIGTGAIGTGVDGLQHVCNRLIVAVLPWTAAEFEQLKGRLFRQGQSKPVTVVIPVTSAEVHGERWSWCESRLARLRFKKSIADAAVDGVVPEGHLRSPEQAYRDVMGWLDRLDRGEIETITRPQLAAPASSSEPTSNQAVRRHYGEFSDLNRSWNTASSATTHDRLQADPSEWAHYHNLFRQARQHWALVPCDEMIHWCRKRTGLAIGDFGCGEAALATAVSDLHSVHSFDHVAAHPTVTACDLASVPLPDGTLDLAVFSLSLMGANFADYLREAHRTLRLDGELHIYEATSRFTDRNRFTHSLADLGFAIVAVEDRWKFTHIRALKTDRRPHEVTALAF